MFVRPSILAAAVLVAGFANAGIVAGPALAQSPQGIEVFYGDLNLGNLAGREVLDRRIANAAAQVCGQFRNVELNWAAAVQACRTETIALTEPQRNAAIGLSGTVQVSDAGQIVRVSRAAN